MSLADADLDGPGSTVSKSQSQERWILLTLGAVQFTSIVDFMVVMPLGSQLMRVLKLDAFQFALIVSAYTISAGIAGVVASSVIDRFGRKSAFLSLYFGFLVGTLLCGLAPSYETLLAARVVTGAFGGVLGGMSMAIIGDVFPDERRGQAMGSLMSAFALASVVGVPFGLFLGGRYDWHMPFLMLVALGLPVMALGMWSLPPLRGHLGRAHVSLLDQLKQTYTHPNHVRCFLLITSVMFGTFMVVPFIAPVFVANVGVREQDLLYLYIIGGVLSLVGAPLIGRWADRAGKLRVYRFIAPASALVILLLTNLPRVGLWPALTCVGLLMLSNSGRMVAAMALITGSVEPRLRGGFMSAHSSVQHVASGVGAFVAGKILFISEDGVYHRFWLVGLIGAASTVFSLWLAGRLRPAAASPQSTRNRMRWSTRCWRACPPPRRSDWDLGPSISTTHGCQVRRGLAIRQKLAILLGLSA